MVSYTENKELFEVLVRSELVLDYLLFSLMSLSIWLRKNGEIGAVISDAKFQVWQMEMSPGVLLHFMNLKGEKYIILII